MELEAEMEITKVAVKAKLVDAQVVRKMTVTLKREFDIFLARAIGGDAKELLDALSSGGAEKVQIPIDTVIASLNLHVGGSGVTGTAKEDKVSIGRCFGKKAVATEAKTEDTKPSIALDFEFLFDERAWAWFGRNVGGFATVDIKPSQLTLAKKAS